MTKLKTAVAVFVGLFFLGISVLATDAHAGDKVKITSATVSAGSTIKSSSGDEAGTQKGVSGDSTGVSIKGTSGMTVYKSGGGSGPSKSTVLVMGNQDDDE